VAPPTIAVAAVRRVQVPSIAITGEDDQYAPVEFVTAFARQVPGCSLAVLPGCGHLPFLEAPDLFASRIRSFLDTL